MPSKCSLSDCNILISDKDRHNLCSLHRSCDFHRNCSICAAWDLQMWREIVKPATPRSRPNVSDDPSSTQVRHYLPVNSTSGRTQVESNIDPTFSIPNRSNFCPGTASTPPIAPRQPRGLSPHARSPPRAMRAPVAYRGYTGSPSYSTDDESDSDADVLTLQDDEPLYDRPINQASVSERIAMDAAAGVLPEHVIPPKVSTGDSFECTQIKPARPNTSMLRLAPDVSAAFTILNEELKEERFQKSTPAYFSMDLPTKLHLPHLIPATEFKASAPRKDTSNEVIGGKRPENVPLPIHLLRANAKMHRATLLNASEAATFCETLTKLIPSAAANETMKVSEFCRDIDPIVKCIGRRLGNIMPIMSRSVANDVLIQRDSILQAGRFSQDSSNLLRNQPLTAPTLFDNVYSSLKDDLVRTPASRKRPRKAAPATDYAAKYAPPPKKQYDDYRPPAKRSNNKPARRAPKKSFRQAGGKRGRK